ncbi:unnamed protein product [Rotaria sp. Silwood2]|nr:unnamed protein product [Rotaria sp. Silwood2]CAF4222553.1 unnamed protein product [Rotaria sp. Silwood2]
MPEIGSIQVIRKPDGSMAVIDASGREYPISRIYGWSSHNCSCRGRKTGLVLYPSDISYKNIVLLVCENCYGYTSNDGTQHEQLLRWYYRIYGDSKQYRCVSGFSLKDDGSLGFNSYSQNATGPYSDGTRQMGSIEQAAVQAVINGKLDRCII